MACQMISDSLPNTENWCDPYIKDGVLYVRERFLRHFSDGRLAENLNSLLFRYLPNNLTVVDISSSNITDIPFIPTLKKLYCGGNHIKKIKLPEGLEVLDISNNPIYEVVFPESLLELNSLECPILKYELPSNLKKFSAGFWRSEYPETLPEGLIELQLSCIMSFNIIKFPASLKTIFLAGRVGLSPAACKPLKTIPVLPDGLINLTIFEMFLENAPEIPETVESLIMVGNHFRKISMLPKSLKYLDLTYNKYLGFFTAPDGFEQDGYHLRYYKKRLA